MSISSNAVSLAGEFAVLSQLALRGYDANLTLGHTKGVDILVSDPRTGRMLRLEVKTASSINRRSGALRTSSYWGRTYNWIMSQKHEEWIDPVLYYCFVSITGQEATSLQFFIVPSEVVAEYVKDQHRLWLDGDSARKDSKIRTFRLAADDGPYPLPTPAAAAYENNWSFDS